MGSQDFCRTFNKGVEQIGILGKKSVGLHLKNKRTTGTGIGHPSPGPWSNPRKDSKGLCQDNSNGCRNEETDLRIIGGQIVETIGYRGLGRETRES